MTAAQCQYDEKMDPMDTTSQFLDAWLHIRAGTSVLSEKHAEKASTLLCKTILYNLVVGVCMCLWICLPCRIGSLQSKHSRTTWNYSNG